MSKMIQVRNVPDELHHCLKARARQAGKSLSDYLLDELREYATRPTLREWLDAAEEWETVEISESPSSAISAKRDRR